MSVAIPRRLLAVADWPEIDRQVWNRALGGDYAATLRPEGLRLLAEGYGRWLAVLASLERLETRCMPADRVTPDAVQVYVEALRGVGNKHLTVVLRLVQLTAVMRIMAPERSFLWLHPSRVLGARRPLSVVSALDHQLRGWPDEDKRLWHQGTRTGDILGDPGYAVSLRPRTIDSIVTGYRCWLVFLRARGLLDPSSLPAARVTRDNVIAYVQWLQEGRCNTSLIARLSELRGAMRIMHPDTDFRWLTSPGGRALSSIFPVVQTAIQVFDSKVLYRWGRAMMEGALNNPHPDHRRISYRNGLLIALFAARAPRVGSMESLRLGETVVLSGKRYKLIFEKEDVKTSRSIEYHAPAGLSAAIRHYAEVVRVELMVRQSHSWFWVNKYGERLSADEIGNMIQRQSKRSFGSAFGPHSFRHAMGTTAPLADPAHPGVAAAILGVSGRMVEDHYNRATQADAAHCFHASLAEDRARLQSLARREFRRR